MTFCDACETCSHCLRNGCIPITPAKPAAELPQPTETQKIARVAGRLRQAEAINRRPG